MKLKYDKLKLQEMRCYYFKKMSDQNLFINYSFLKYGVVRSNKLLLTYALLELEYRGIISR